ncbi:MAG: penicillin-binding transpeptidase domain-containing protein [Minisyncoccia bacterium]
MDWIDEEILKEKEDVIFKKIEFPKILYYIFLIILFISTVIGFKIIILENKKWSLYAKENLSIKLLQPAPRGLIFDRNKNPLATNLSSFDLVLDFTHLKDSDRDYFLDLINKYNFDYEIDGNVLIAKNIPKDLAFNIMIHYPNYLNVRIINSFSRFYPYKEALGNLIGYLGFPNDEEIKEYNVSQKDYVGKEGLEKTYQKFLSGIPGVIELEKDTRENIIKTIEKKEARPGYNIELSIDANFQKKAYELMDKYFKENGYKKGGLIVMNPKTGEIISLISYPSYDNNIFISDRERINEVLNNQNNPLFNRIVSGLYNPGSTIKPILAIGALEEKIIDPNKKILANGEIKIPNPYFPGKYSIFKDWKVHGWVDMREAIANSVNVYFYTIGGGYDDQAGLGIWRIKKYFELFGLGRKTGIDLLGEKDGYIGDPNLKKRNVLDPIWRIGDTYNVSIGQGEILVTPLQIALFTSALAENKIVVPYLVKKIYDQNGNIIYERKPIVLKENLVNQENLKIVQEGMRMTVTSGTAKILNYLKIEVAGKSGTPQIFGKKKLNAIFTGYAPYNNPEIVMTLFIEEVPTGSVATLPLYKSLMELYFGK